MAGPPSLGHQGRGDFDFLRQLGVPGLQQLRWRCGWVEASPRSLRPELSAELLGWKVALFLAWHGSVNFCGHLEIGALSLSFFDDSSSGT